MQHRHKHKKDCEEHIRLAAERAAAKLYDEKLFKQPPLEEDCPICFLRMPLLNTGPIIHVAGKRYVADVFMRLSMTMKGMKLIIKSAPFAELQHQLRKRRWSKGRRSEWI